MPRLVFLNALPLNAFPIDEYGLKIGIVKVSLYSVKPLVKDWARAGVPIECYIRHRATVELLNKLLGLDMKPSDGLYRYSDGDKIIVVTLKKPLRGQEVDVKPQDIVFYIAEVEEE